MTWWVYQVWHFRKFFNLILPLIFWILSFWVSLRLHSIVFFRFYIIRSRWIQFYRFKILFLRIQILFHLSNLLFEIDWNNIRIFSIITLFNLLSFRYFLLWCVTRFALGYIGIGFIYSFSIAQVLLIFTIRLFFKIDLKTIVPTQGSFWFFCFSLWRWKLWWQAFLRLFCT